MIRIPPSAALAPLVVVIALVAALLGPAPARAAEAAAASPPAPCARAAVAPGLTVISVRRISAPVALCEVTGRLSGGPGSSIGVVYRLPDGWNGKVLGFGGGGWAGDLRPETAAAALAKGYATLQTDAGHPSAVGSDASWSLLGPGKQNREGLIDFGWRAVHLMTVAGKALAADYYGRQPERSYFQGCSTGGRMGLMEAQRFPDDYDGIIAGAPVYDLLVQTSALLRTQAFHKDAESALTPDQPAMINRAVLAACDRLDGAEDGLVSNPFACRWDPAALACRAGASTGCLSPKQVAAVRRAYAGVTTRNGRVAAWPLPHGGELDWLPRSVGDARNPIGSNATTGARAIQYFVYSDPAYDINGWNAESDLDAVVKAGFAQDYVANDPDLSRFVRHGGKLILWHGQYDPGPSYLATIAYYEKMQRAVGSAGAGAARLFLAPGVFHCNGGPGTDRFDMIEALDGWVSQGRAPDAIPAVSATSGLSRALCAYPEVAIYDRRGDPKAAASFTCRAPGRSPGRKG